MFYQEALPKFRFLSHVDNLLTIGDRQVAATFKKAESANSLSVGTVTGAFSSGVPIFVWGLINTMWLL